MMTKLNLGCGDRKIPGFINVDSRKDVEPEVCIDLVDLDKNFKDGEADLIYLCHVLEHIEKRDISSFVECLYRKLRVGGTLRVSVPDFDSIVNYYNITKDVEPLQALLHGGHKYREDYHFASYNLSKLTRLLVSFGFKGVKRYDWRQTEHFYIDDYSQSYLPHLDKQNGMLMSLNVEAIK